jgi:Zn-dependent protease with chaperone function
MNQFVTISPAFRKSAIKAICSIILFIAFYLFVLAGAIGLVLLCVYFAINLIIFKPAFITLVLAAGIIGFGILILVFLIKFLFKKNVTDRSGMTELRETEQPELFAYISEIVRAVGTRFPKKIYITHDVNAFVFYDSSMLSMFLPVKKNLAIGLGLVNTVNRSELKAILGHEFGHFSQRSMKIGSYVYNVNKVIYDMLFENNAYGNMIQSWSGIHSIISIFVVFAVKIVQSIQWVLSKIYRLVNIHHLSLSRAMEFHADEVAASITGSKPLVSSLLRLNLADHAYNEVLRFYSSRLKDRVHSANIYPEQWHVMLFESEQIRIPLSEGFPEVTPEEMGRFNKSKLVVKNQWASHPETEERVENLQRLNTPGPDQEHAPAWTLFRNKTSLQEQITRQIFSLEKAGTGPISLMELAGFTAVYEEEYRKNNFPASYFGYYDHHNPAAFDLDGTIGGSSAIQDANSFFTPAHGEQAAAIHAMSQDLQGLRQIASGTTPVKYFDYDGRKYTLGESTALVEELEQELKKSENQLQETDKAAYAVFAGKASAAGKLEELKQKYISLFSLERKFEAINNAYADIRSATQFMFEVLQPDLIRSHIQDLYQAEIHFRKQLRIMLDGTDHRPVITGEIQKDLETYMAAQHIYFDGRNYDDMGTEILFTAINHYEYVASSAYFKSKKELLEFQLQL